MFQFSLGLTSPLPEKRSRNHKFGRKNRKLRNHISLAWEAACLRLYCHSVIASWSLFIIHKLGVMVVKDYESR